MRELRVEIPGRSYTVHVGARSLERTHELIPGPLKAEKIALFGDDALLEDERAIARITEGLRPLELAIRRLGAHGEDAKSVATADWMWQALATNGFHRNDLIVAFGGGVISDLAGFVAATYHRGMPWIAVPTTLLAMVDAAIGGKTGINTPQGKNLVGAFHQPLAVIADVSMLESLPDAAFRTGLAEVIKHGLIADTELFSRVQTQRDAILARDAAVLENLVADAAAVKVGIVSQDETEQGARAHLNYGHTLGHALETLGGYKRFTHGEAVSIGMMFAAHLARALGHSDRVEDHRRAIEAFGLPVSGAAEDFEQVHKTFARDKKYETGVRFVVLEDLGKPVVVSGVPEQALRDAYEAVR